MQLPAFQRFTLPRFSLFLHYSFCSRNTLLAQAPEGTIRGVVRDDTGAVVTKTTLRVRQPQFGGGRVPRIFYRRRAGSSWLGVLGYVVKAYPGREQLVAVEAVRQSRRFVSAGLAGHVPAELGDSQVSEPPL